MNIINVCMLVSFLFLFVYLLFIDIHERDERGVAHFGIESRDSVS